MSRKTPPVGIIGLGIIGSRVAAQVRNAGFDVWVWNRSPRQEPNFLGSAAEVVETADIIQIFVSDGQALIDTVRAMAPTLAARHVILNHATVSPNEVMQAAAIAAESSAGFLDAPFTGSRMAAESGQLVYYVGGPEELIDRVRPVLQASSKAILPVGAVGQASLLKIMTNLISATTVQALAEAMAVLNKAGVPLPTFVEAMRLNAANSVTAQMKLPAMIAGNFDAHFSLKHMFKDVQLGLAESKSSGVEMPAVSAVAGALMSGMQNGWGDLDFAALAKHYDYPGKNPAESAALLQAASDSIDPVAPQAKRMSFFPIFGRRG